MNKTNHLLYLGTLKNNCPECFATNGMEVSFSQEEIETVFQIKAKKTIQSQITCTTCTTPIYPIQYTPDIERVFEYHYKLALSHKRKSKWKPLAFVLLILTITAVSALLYIVIIQLG